ncbi:MAG: NAD(P)-dependent alcohol dehydrogenase [Anaerolineae bacterium]|nr:NAD(P)-dependent alcohol dehydrogenase [Anaerolineae bacterium]
MKAIALTRYGSPDGLQLTEVEKPTPKDYEALIRVRATTVTAGDAEIRTLNFPVWLMLPVRLYVGFIRPRNFILGQELAGDIVAVGKNVTRFKEGDPVFGTTGFRFGAHAEYACLPEAGVLAIKPSKMTYEEAATVPVAGIEALHFMRKANIHSGEKVLIVGAGGSIGTIGVQLARYLGAEVTGVDSTGKLDMLRSIGADHTIDYTKEDFTQNGQTYDVIFDVMGKGSFSGSIQSLKPNGRYLLGGNSGPSQLLRGRWVSMTGSQKVIVGAASQKTEDLVFLKELIEGSAVR